MPLINLQANPVWKQLFSVLSRIMCRFLKPAREHDGTGASLQIPALQVLLKERHRHVHRTQLYHHHPLTSGCLWHLPCPRSGHTSPVQGCWDKAVSTLWVPSSHLSDELSLEAAGWCCWVEITPLHSLCIVLTSPSGKLIRDILMDLCDLLNPLQHLTYWRNGLSLWGAQ